VLARRSLVGVLVSFAVVENQDRSFT